MRFIAPWKDSTEKPAIYHCISKEVVDAELARLERSRDVALGQMLRCRVRYSIL
jgi:hypothetical protein